MNDSQAPKDPVERDLTSTIHLSALRSVPKPRPLEEIYTFLSGEEREIVSQLPKNSAMLIVIAGANRGARFLIVHAKISRSAAGDFAVHDCGSLNGSYLNAHQITESNLAVGDEIQIGKFRLTYFKGRAN